jgi:heme/copper-type cytochrome/quinol oxidase subunit 1
MKAENIGAMIARAAGFMLIIIGASSFLYLIPWFEPPATARSGWTSYAPNSAAAFSQDLTTQLHDTYSLVAGTVSFYFPSAAQVIIGLLIVWLSRPIGRRLAKGLGEEDNA